MVNKVKLGQFFTKKDVWLKPQVIDFISKSSMSLAYDPFAGNGDILDCINGNYGIKGIKGLDIDPSLSNRWDINDSLIMIPQFDNSIIITNPPYLTNHTAKRKNVLEKSNQKYFDTGITDLYQIALYRCLESSDYVVAIIPETFINSSFPKERLISITVLEENPFEDTENPVCVVCFDHIKKPLSEIEVYKNTDYLGTLDYFESHRMVPRFSLPMRFNDIDGLLALRAIDLTTLDKPIEFMIRDNLVYDLDGIKHSSRLITLIDIPKLPKKDVDALVPICNNILAEYRQKTFDLLLSPFKGNTKSGSRRRRLDYKAARAIIENAYSILNSHEIYTQLTIL